MRTLPLAAFRKRESQSRMPYRLILSGILPRSVMRNHEIIKAHPGSCQARPMFRQGFHMPLVYR